MLKSTARGGILLGNLRRSYAMKNISFYHAFIPACISFGPIAMTRMAGTVSGELSDTLVSVGGFMLMFGLYLMFGLIAKQQIYIEKLEEERAGNNFPASH